MRYLVILKDSAGQARAWSIRGSLAEAQTDAENQWRYFAYCAHYFGLDPVIGARIEKPLPEADNVD